MARNIQFIDVDSEEFEDSPKGLRDAYKALRKQYETQTSELDGVRGKLSSHVIGGVLKDQGYKNPKRVEKDLLAEGVDPTDNEAVTGWLAEFGDDYAKGDPTPAPAPVQDEASQEQQAGYEQLASVGGGLTSAGGMSKWDLAQSEITPDMDGDAVIAVYKKHGI